MKVLVFGTFDLFHKGHEYFLGKAKEYGDLVVVVARDCTVNKLKGQKPWNDQNKRVTTLKSSGFDAVIGYNGDKLKIIEEIRPDVICLGYDQSSFTEGLGKKLEKRGLNAKIIRLEPFRPDVFKSSKLKEYM
ncbi:adenylyltransferase/cytidyltransferase family protein [archaeon]|jgi:FAD synthetase|nr:adenylyltransferase/cytidyltransferase family protein [archaeon]MBT4397342.1 adenylyltransferase/cytidyltransferase family protein [archaeon]MBT4440722.1 adenylyltransferase/cytidyltransferase family protein [archaeon]